ncbi:glycosyltransferase family 2 protein [Mucilaginibacter sp. OK283]|uniref:glycosyltransferase family 2 protein n=1 Tax=Mucilaginibacter sp. OK283 TaxID=1881049 RepID=UPI0008BA1C06|nr:glycosyltransferase family 2 protein [Mucilaginibacter sp. OK283]SEO12097.1 hypothetical protein SAMN05428947_101378 [Mucilaginibacter sp. OK283]
MNKVYIILVNYKRYEDTIECLESVYKSYYNNYQVLLVDNSPDEQSSHQIKEWLENNYKEINTSYPNIVYPLIDRPTSYVSISEYDVLNTNVAYTESLMLIRATNNGFAAANNIALKYIKKIADEHSFIWVLNNDTVIEHNCMGNLAAFFDTNPRKFILGSKLRSYYSPQKIQAVAGRYNRWIGSTYHIGEGEIDHGQYDDFAFGDNNYVIGASMFIPKAFIDIAGLMNESYFLYFEELDWGLVGKQFGYNFALQHNAIIYHKEGASIIKSNNNNMSVADYYSMINRIRFTKKWYGRHIVLVSCSVVFALLKRLFRGKFSLVKKTSIAVFKIFFNRNINFF